VPCNRNCDNNNTSKHGDVQDDVLAKDLDDRSAIKKRLLVRLSEHKRRAGIDLPGHWNKRLL
jgi:hypothetical protein